MYIKNMLRDAALEIQHMSVEDKAAEIESGEYVTTAYRVKRHNEDTAAENSASYEDLDCVCQDHYSHESGESWV